MKSIRLFLPLTVAALFGAACSKSPDHATAGKSAHSKHVHLAPHGGTLVEIGEHAYNVELLRDPAIGKLTAWIFDGHAENFVRISGSSFEIVATVGGEARRLVLAAVANAATGEKLGDTSQFEVTADWLKTAASFDAGIPELAIKGASFKATAFNFPKGSD
jgi:hypothetical protein